VVAERLPALEELKENDYPVFQVIITPLMVFFFSPIARITALQNNK
jgi:hypothetical protein